MRELLKRFAIELITEAAPHRFRSGIVLTHGRQTENQFYRAKHGRSGIHSMVDEFALYKSSGHISRSAVCIHMIRSVLCIVLHNKYSGFFPDRAFGQVFNKHPNGQIIIRHVGKRCRPAQALTFCMIIDQAE